MFRGHVYFPDITDTEHKNPKSLIMSLTEECISIWKKSQAIPNCIGRFHSPKWKRKLFISPISRSKHSACENEAPYV